MTNPKRARAGWYPDPLGQARLRWWDNHTWTTHISNSNAATIAPDEVVESPTLTRAAASANAPLAPQRYGTATRASYAATTFATAPSGPEPSASLPTATGASEWASVAAALNQASAATDEPIVIVRIPGAAPLVVDVAERCYWWDGGLSALPLDPGPLGIDELPRALAPVPDIAGNDLDPLLWLIGKIAFRSALPEWLDAGDRHRLRRWPNMPALDHSADELRMMTFLSHASLNVAELAATADVRDADARALVGACSLMGVLRTVPGAVDGSEHSARTTRASRGLFGRLRSRLGGSARQTA